MEVSVFGPGIGECVLVAPRPDYWIVVDSCRVDGRPVALHYLESLGLSPSAVVREVICTHWHDDHHDGIAEVLRACPQARFWCSAALRSSEFLTLAATARRQYDGKQGVSELAEVLETLHERKEARVGKASVSPRWADEGKRLLREADFEVWSLSPSAATVARAHHEFAELLPGLRTPKRRLAANQANDTSVVLHMTTASFGSVLLGSDLETRKDPSRGWTAAFGQFEAQFLPQAHTYKVAHHGSETGDAKQVWESMLEPSPTAVVTPFRSCHLPRQSDLERIRVAHTGQTFLTASPRGAKPRRRRNSVEKMMRLVAPDRRVEAPGFGHVRVRALRDGNRTVESFGDSREVGVPDSA